MALNRINFIQLSTERFVRADQVVAFRHDKEVDGEATLAYFHLQGGHVVSIPVSAANWGNFRDGLKKFFDF